MSATTLSIEYSAASQADEGKIHQLLEQLLAELGPKTMAERVKPRLLADTRKALASQDVCIFLARSSEHVIGLSRADILRHDPVFRLRDDNRCGYVDQMFVLPNYRGKGIGRELLRRCEAWFRERGVGHALLHASRQANKFYEKAGYQTNRELYKKL